MTFHIIILSSIDRYLHFLLHNSELWKLVVTSIVAMCDHTDDEGISFEYLDRRTTFSSIIHASFSSSNHHSGLLPILANPTSQLVTPLTPYHHTYREPGASHLPPPLSYIPTRVTNHPSISILSTRNPSNIISIKPLCSVPLNHSQHLSFHLLNVRNLRTKSSRCLDYVIDYQPDIVAITETWFKPRDAAARAECTPSGQWRSQTLSSTWAHLGY